MKRTSEICGYNMLLRKDFYIYYLFFYLSQNPYIIPSEICETADCGIDNISNIGFVFVEEVAQNVWTADSIVESITDIKHCFYFCRGGRSKCLRDAPGRSVTISTSLPGQDYTLDDQCKLMVKGSTGFCKNPGNMDVCFTWIDNS